MSDSSADPSGVRLAWLSAPEFAQPMEQDEFNERMDVALQEWERRLSENNIELILTQYLQPLVARIESLEDALGGRSASADGSGGEPEPGANLLSRRPPPPPPRSILPVNPYGVDAGPQLDSLVHIHVMKLPNPDGACPAYSSDLTEAKKVLAQLKSAFSTAVISGRTSIAGRAWYARFATSSNHGTEVLADTLPLAICRLSLLLFEQVERRLDANAKA